METTCKELRESGFMPERTFPIENINNTLNGHARKAYERIELAEEPPVQGARLGRTPSGDPAWFIVDPEREGKYLMLESEEVN